MVTAFGKGSRWYGFSPVETNRRGRLIRRGRTKLIRCVGELWHFPEFLSMKYGIFGITANPQAENKWWPRSGEKSLDGTVSAR